MRYKHFGKIGWNVSSLTIGTWAMGGTLWGEVDEKDCNDAVRAMVEQGVNHLDTAVSYQDGGSEKAVGKAIKGLRDKLYISTKCVLVMRDGKFYRDGSYKCVLECCDTSLQRMGLDYIDNYLMHWPDVNTPIEETMSALNQLKKEGKIRHISVSNFSKEQILEAEKYGSIDAVQMPYSMVDRSSEEFLQWAHDRGMGCMTYSSLGSGILTGAFRTLPNFAPNDARVLYYDFYKEPRFSKIQGLLRVMDEISARNGGVPLAQIALNWSTQKEFVHTALTGVRNPAEANENCAGMAWNLSQEDIAILDAAIAKTEETTNDK